MPDPKKPNGLVLAGGHSTRMGTDKSLLEYHGKPQREFLFDLLGRRCHNVYTSCRKEQHVPESLNPLFDAFAIAGPLNGILSAFQLESATPWLVVAIDMPFVDDAVIEKLFELRDPNKLATCFYNPQTSQPEPLLCLWEAEAKPHLLTFAQAGNLSPREFLKTHPIKVVQAPDPRALINYNSPGESQQFER